MCLCVCKRARVWYAVPPARAVACGVSHTRARDMQWCRPRLRRPPGAAGVACWPARASPRPRT
eukprot:1636005-Prymnesium_polylepis.1